MNPQKYGPNFETFVKMKHLPPFTALLLTVFMPSCDTSKPKSMQEARARIDAEIRYGVVTKDEKSAALAMFATYNLPETARRPLDSKAIDKRAMEEARELGNLARYRAMYNSGQINRDELERRFVKEQERILAIAQAALPAMLAFSAAQSQSAQMINAANATAYSTPSPAYIAPVYPSSPVVT